jgi:hypothetical protein
MWAASMIAARRLRKTSVKPGHSIAIDTIVQ